MLSHSGRGLEGAPWEWQTALLPSCLSLQMVITASQIQWTTDVSKCLATCKDRGDKKYLKAMKKKQVRRTSTWLSALPRQGCPFHPRHSHFRLGACPLGPACLPSFRAGSCLCNVRVQRLASPLLHLESKSVFHAKAFPCVAERSGFP